MNEAINTTFEFSLRVILLLESFGKPVDAEILTAADFIATYGKSFGISDFDLNGTKENKLSEKAARRYYVREALRQLVLKGLATVVIRKNMFLYKLTDLGREFCNKLRSDYASDYRESSSCAINFIRKKSVKAIYVMIDQRLK